MIVCKYLSWPVEEFYNFLVVHNSEVLEIDLILHILLENNVYGVHILHIDDVNFRINPDTFGYIGSFNLTYDDELTMTSNEMQEAIELEIVANNI